MQLGRHAIAAAPTALTSPKLPSPRPSVLSVVNDKRIEPLRQGQLDGLCGLYATINALRLALLENAPLSRRQCKRLFLEGTHFLNRRGKLDEIVGEGMGLGRRLLLARHLAKSASTEKLVVQVQRPEHQTSQSIEDVFAWIEASLAARQPVLIPLLNTLDHYSVVAGTTDTTLHLFDSAGFSFVRKSNCGLRRGIHHIPPAGLLRFMVIPTG